MSMTDDIIGDLDELLLNELMILEQEYAEWINGREDYVTQKSLYRDEALYYKRLFVIPLNDFYLEKERMNLLDDQMTGTMRDYKKGEYDKEMQEQRM